MAQWLEKYRNCEVEIHYVTDNAMFTDKGRLTDFGDNWLELVKNAGKRGAETLLIPITAIRIVKIMDAPERDDIRLLRPSYAPEQVQQVEQ
ncbi:MAG TPA: hypothetical protein VNJ09_09940 [Chthonomonadales bacterium]|nr:hypothetical protein [Chthonomonadales bacterium]